MTFDQFTLWRADRRPVGSRVDRHLHDLGDVKSSTSADVLNLFAATETVGDNEGALLGAIEVRRKFFVGDLDGSFVLLFFETERTCEPAAAVIRHFVLHAHLL